MICRCTLKKISSGSFSKKAQVDFFGKQNAIHTLPFSREVFLTQGVKYSQGMSISGVQKKLSLAINGSNEFEIVSTNGTYILKPSPESFPFAAENELCAMSISRLVGIETAFCANIPFSDGEQSFITKRYDRVLGNKLHQEDLAQAFDVPSEKKYSKSYEEALHLCRQMCGGKLSVVKDLFNRIVLAYIIGNDDMHLKNISLIKEVHNKTPFYDGLTPNYDQLLVHAFPNPPKLGFLALDLLKEEADGVFSDRYNQYGFYTGYDFCVLGERVGLRQPVIEGLFKNYFQKEVQIVQIIQNSFMPANMKEKAQSLVQARIQSLKIL
jgi:serine/threonine-protein kinase HipA